MVQRTAAFFYLQLVWVNFVILQLLSQAENIVLRRNKVTPITWVFLLQTGKVRKVIFHSRFLFHEHCTLKLILQYEKMGCGSMHTYLTWLLKPVTALVWFTDPKCLEARQIHWTDDFFSQYWETLLGAESQFLLGSPQPPNNCCTTTTKGFHTVYWLNASHSTA